jgi:Lon-like ATP-dependent protease
VFDLIFPNLDREKANKCKICENKKDAEDSSSKSDEDGSD